MGDAQLLSDDVRSRLRSFPLLNAHMGRLILQRCTLADAASGVIIANMLDECDESRHGLTLLETVLQFSGFCENFDEIFSGVRLTRQDDADLRLLNCLSEVKAFEWLARSGFRDISKVMVSQGNKNMDFLATRNGTRYALEVTRIGDKYSKNFTPVHCAEDPNWSMSIHDQNLPKRANVIYDTLVDKHSQMKAFCCQRNPKTRSVLFVSSGGDYFLYLGKADAEFRVLPETLREAAAQAFEDYKKEHAGNWCIDELVVTRGPYLGNALQCPERV